MIRNFGLDSVSGRRWSTSTLALPIAALMALIVLPSPALADTPVDASVDQVSVSGSGQVGNGVSAHPSISQDGRFVAFDSTARNLTGVTAGVNVFVRDTLAKTTVLASTSSAGVAGDGDSRLPSMSADGGSVVFESTSTQLTIDTPRGTGSEIFVRHLATGTTSLVSVTTDGDAMVGASRPSISADGRYVAFEAWNDIYVRDLVDKSTTLVDAPAGESDAGHPRGFALSPRISANGRYVAFYSNTDGLVASDDNGGWDTFLRDTATGTTVLVNVGNSGEANNHESGGSAPPAISSDGRYVAFISRATNLDPRATNGTNHVFVRDVVAGTTTLVDMTATHGQADGPARAPAISDDGRYVAFISNSSNLLAQSGGFEENLLVHDLVTNTNVQSSTTTVDGSWVRYPDDPQLSGDGAYVTWSSDHPDGTTNPRYDVFIRSLRSGPPVSSEPTASIAGGAGVVPPTPAPAKTAAKAKPTFVVTLARTGTHRAARLAVRVTGRRVAVGRITVVFGNRTIVTRAKLVTGSVRLVIPARMLTKAKTYRVTIRYSGSATVSPSSSSVRVALHRK